MTTRKLTEYVHVVDKDGRMVTLSPGDTPPAWAKDQVTNPKCWGHDDEDEGDKPAASG